MRSSWKYFAAPLPFIVLAWYAAVIADYLKYFRADGSFRPPALPSAREDLLGFGPTFNLFFFGVTLAVACVPTYMLGARKHRFYLVAVLLFIGIAMADQYLAARIAAGLSTQP